MQKAITVEAAGGKKVTWAPSANDYSYTCDTICNVLNETGMLKTPIETWYFPDDDPNRATLTPPETGSYTSQDYIYYDTYYATATWDGGSQDYAFTVKSYDDEWVNNKVDSILAEIIHDGMTNAEKAEAITKYVAKNYDYSIHYYSAYGMLKNGEGDCWASARLVKAMGERAGLVVNIEQANWETGAGSGHENATFVFEDENGKKHYYTAEAGYVGKKPRYYSFYEKPELITYPNYDDTALVHCYARNTDIVIPDDITQIGSDTNRSSKYPFDGQNIHNLTIGKNVNAICEGSLSLIGVGNVTVDEENPNFTSRDNAVYSKDMKKLIAVSDNYTGSEAIADVEELGRGAFYECSAQRIILPDTLKKLDDYALYSPGKVTKIIIPSSVTFIGEKVFCGNHFAGAPTVTYVFENGDLELRLDMFDADYTDDTVIAAPAGSKVLQFAEANGIAHHVITADDLVPDAVSSIKPAEAMTFADSETPEEHQASVAEAAQKLAEARQQYEDAKNAYNAAKASLDAVKSSDPAKMEADAKQAVADAQAAVNEAQTALTSAQQNKTAADQKFKQACAAYADAQSKAEAAGTALTKAQVNAQAASSAYDKAAAEAKTSAEAKAQAEQALTDAQNALDTLDARTADALAKKNETSAAYDAAVKTAGEKAEALKKAEAAKASADKALADAKTKAEETGRALADAESAFEDASAKYETAKAAADKADAELASANSDYLAKKQVYDAAVKTSDEADKNLADAKDALAKAEQAVTDTAEAYESTKAQLADAAAKADETAKAKAEKNEAYKNAFADLLDAQTKDSAAEKKLKNAQKALADAQARSAAAEKALADAQEAVKTAEKNLTDAKAAVPVTADIAKRAEKLPSAVTPETEDITDPAFTYLNPYIQAVRDAQKKADEAKAAYDKLAAVYADASDKADEAYKKYQDAEEALRDAREDCQRLAPAVSMLEGMNAVWEDGDGNLRFRSSAEFRTFKDVRIDGYVLDNASYTVSEGSTVVMLDDDYLAGLADGVHTISIDSEYGDAETSFTIKDKAPVIETEVHADAGSADVYAAPAEKSESPNTGDPVTDWIGLTFLGSMAGVYVFAKKRHDAE